MHTHRFSRAFRPLPVVASAMLGCAHTPPLPHELVAARAAYNRAAQNPGAEMAQAELQTARVALHRAERHYAETPGAVETRDVAYVAQRRAQLAESVASMELAQAQRIRADRELDAQRTRLVADAQNAAKLRDQVAREQNSGREALQRLSQLNPGVRQDSRGLVVTLATSSLFANRANLSAAGRAQLDQLAEALRGTVAQSIDIEGYTDGRGQPEKNETLSQSRAQAVLDYLAARGVPTDRLQATGRGASSPIASNNTAAGRAANRRIEVVVQAEASASR